MKGDYYIAFKMSPTEKYLHVIGPRLELCVDEDAVWKIFVTKSRWEFRVGHRQVGLRGWKTLAGAKRSKQYRSREGLYPIFGIRVHQEIGDEDVLVVVEEQQGVVQDSRSADPGQEDLFLTLHDRDDD